MVTVQKTPLNYCSFFLYCTVFACAVCATTLAEVFLYFFLSCKANARV
jgi:hypothetical protein